VLPHLESDLRLAGAIAGAERAPLTAALGAQRHELGALIEELDGHLLDAGARPSATAPRRGAVRTLGAVARLLDRHLVTETELWSGLGAGPDTDPSLSTLIEEAEAGESVAARSLRYVWHPPLAPTESIVLRRNPRAWLVVTLDGVDAARLPNGDGMRRN
jgi:hypothetical protein